MFGIHSSGDKAKLAALDRSQAIIEFGLDGTILTANDNFLKTFGYTLDEIQGRHHSIFVDEAYRKSDAYRQFWQALRDGAFQSAEFKRYGKNGQPVWIQATYTPLVNRRGQPLKVIKFATDITEQKQRAAEYESQIAALQRTQAIIEFSPAGTILTANENFLAVLGYRLDEIEGQSHAMFVLPEYRNSEDYRRFWQSLANGQHYADEYKRVAKGGRQIWLRGIYTPVFDENEKVRKVVKFARDITREVELRHRLEAGQRAIDQDLDAITDAVAQAAGQASRATDEAGKVAANVQAVAASAEELAVSAREVSSQVGHALKISTQAVAQARQTNEIVGGLSDAATKIGEVVALIQRIAAQTNLLSLNATIEAARAGEAGRGFAVVAQEVKTLATETAKATDQIATQITESQAAATRAVDAISEIASTISNINDISAAIANAIEEQSGVTVEISGNMQVAARGVSEISNSFGEIAQATAQADNATRKVRDASRSLI